MNRNAAHNTACNFEPLESRQLMSAGAIDQTFGFHGYAGNPFGFKPTDIAVQADNKVVLVGNRNFHAAVARLNANGTADTTFGNGGLVLLPWTRGSRSEARAVSLQSDGKIVVAGRQEFLGWSAAMEVSRLNSNGQLDSTFGNAGTSDLLGVQDQARINDLAIQPDGKIVVAAMREAHRTFIDDTDLLIGRLNSNGQWDSTFGDARSSGRAGYTTTDFGDNEIDPVMTLQPDGKIVVAGISGSFSDGYHKEVLARYTTSGKLDRTFDHDGKVVTEMHYGRTVSAVVVEPSGKILTVGAGEGRYPHNRYFFAIERYNANGSVDQFSLDTRVTASETSSGAASVFVTAPGKFLVVGGVDTGGSSQTFAMSYLDSGARDTSFGNNGIALYGVEGASSAAMGADGRVVAAGEVVLERFQSRNVSAWSVSAGSLIRKTVSTNTRSAADGLFSDKPLDDTAIRI